MIIPGTAAELTIDHVVTTGLKRIWDKNIRKGQSGQPMRKKESYERMDINEGGYSYEDS